MARKQLLQTQDRGVDCGACQQMKTKTKILSPIVAFTLFFCLDIFASAGDACGSRDGDNIADDNSRAELIIIAGRKLQKLQRPVKAKETVVRDAGVVKIEQALAKAKEYKEDGLGKIDEVTDRVDAVKALLDRCPESDKGLVPQMVPIFVAFGPSDSLYSPGAIRSCDHHARNAETAMNNSKRHVDYLGRILSEVNAIEDFINKTCPAGRLSDVDRSSLQGTLSSFKTSAQAEADKFDRFISDIEQFLEDYKECKQSKMSQIRSDKYQKSVGDEEGVGEGD